MTTKYVLQVGTADEGGAGDFYIYEDFSSGDFDKLNTLGYYFWSGGSSTYRRIGNTIRNFMVDTQGSPSAGLIENLSVTDPSAEYSSPYDSYPWTPPQSESPDGVTCVEDASSNWNDSTPSSTRYVLNNTFPPNTALCESQYQWDVDLPEMWWSCWMRIPYNHWHPNTATAGNARKFFTFGQDGYSTGGAGSSFIMGMNAYPDNTVTRYAEKISFDWTPGVYEHLGNKTNPFGFTNYTDGDFIKPGNGPSAVIINGVQDHGKWMRVIVQARCVSAAGVTNKVADGTLKAWIYFEGDSQPAIDNPTIDNGEKVDLLPAYAADPTGTNNWGTYGNPTQGTPVYGFRWGWTMGNWNGVDNQSRQQEWLIDNILITDSSADHWD